jgi:hypothetical protein
MENESVPEFFDVAEPNPCRPPDWRWHRARGIHNHTHPPASRIGDRGPGFGWIRRTLAFLQDLSRCQCTAHHGWLSGQHPSLFLAHRLYSQRECRRTKALVEAYLLTGATNEEITQRFNMRADVVDAYQNVFFHVRDQLCNTHFIETSVIARTSSFHAGYHPCEKLWKSIGYRHGIKVLDAVTTGVLQPGSGRNTSIDGFLRRQVIGLSKLQVAITAIGAEDNPEAQAALMKIYPQLLALEQHELAVGNTDSQLLTHIQAMIDAVNVTVAGQFDEWDESDPLSKYDRGAVELSPEELMGVQQGKKPRAADWLNESVYDRAADQLNAESV